MAVTQQEIESWLWEAANILRGPADPANLRDFVFPLKTSTHRKLQYQGYRVLGDATSNDNHVCVL